MTKVNKKYGERLKELRNRAGVTGRECATAFLRSLGKKTDGVHKIETRWFRYESSEFNDKKVPWRVIDPVIPLLVGKGHPVITKADLIDIADIPQTSVNALLGKSVDNTGQSDRPTSNRRTPFMGARLADTGSVVLRVKFRAEAGVFMTPDSVHSRDYGQAPIAKSDDLVGEQFCALDVQGGFYPSNTVLHCVRAEDVETGDMVGRRVVALEVSPSMPGVGEVVIAKVVSASGNSVELADSMGNEVFAEILGVVRGSYTRE